MRSLGCVVALLLAGCPPARLDVECLSDADCNLGGAGVCTPASTGKQWCAYPDGTCSPTGLRFSDYDVEEGVSGACVPHTPVLTVRLGGKGAGGVFSNPPGLTCSGDTCTGRFPAGTLVQLSAEAAEGAFLGWIDGCRGRATCAVTMDDDHAVGALFGTRGEALWGQQLGSPDAAHGRKIAMDAAGNVVAVGQFFGSITSGLGAGLSSNGQSDGYVIKLAPSGSVLWAKRFGGVMADGANAVVVDGEGDIYVAGSFTGTVDFGDGPRQAGGAHAIFVLKLEADGSFAWARKIGHATTSPSFIDVRAIAAKDGIAVTGRYKGPVVVDTTTFTSPATEEDFFVLRMSKETGAIVWAKPFGGNTHDWVNDIEIDNDGNVVLTGGFTGSVNYGGGTMQAGVGFTFHVFLLKLAASGAHVLSRSFGPPSAFLSAGEAIAIDSANNVYVTGSIHSNSPDPADPNSETDLGCGNILRTGPFIAKYAPNGLCVWAQGFGGTGRGTDISLNTSGEFAVVGHFSGTISIGEKAFSSMSGATDMFTTRFVGDGTHLSSSRAGSTRSEANFGLAHGDDGRLFVTGPFLGTAEFGGDVITATDNSDAFIGSQPPF